MKIIKKGEIPKKKKVVYQFECDNCGTVYRADTNEVGICYTKKVAFTMDVYTVMHITSECPLCEECNSDGKRMEVEEDD